MNIGSYTYEEYVRLVESFHGHMAPGVLLGGFMVGLARKHLPEGILFDAVAETPKCLPDAIQLLTPCTVGNGWLKVLNLGRYALSLYSIENGQGVRVFLDVEKLLDWLEIKTWLFKTKPKAEQDKELLLEQIRLAQETILGLQHIEIESRYLNKRKRGRIDVCSLCGEAYPARDGGICRGCQGESPYIDCGTDSKGSNHPRPQLKAVSLEEALGQTALHDMTQIIPFKSKGAAFHHGHRFTAGDMCRLQQMGRRHVFVAEENPPRKEWVHENEAALAFGQAMAGEGVQIQAAPREGKLTLVASRDGMLLVDVEKLHRFNTVPDVMCASRKSFTLVREGRAIAGTRAIPLFLSRTGYERALTVLRGEPIFQVSPLRSARVGILVTGTEVFQNLVEDRFIPILTAKMEPYGCTVVKTSIVPDDREMIRREVQELVRCGCEVLLTTAGLSVDPDDVTRQGLIDAGLVDMHYGVPLLPGAMTLLGKIAKVPVLGVPACALYFKTTSFDILFPRLLAGVELESADLARLGHGGFCLDCKTCTYPKCTFGS